MSVSFNPSKNPLRRTGATNSERQTNSRSQGVTSLFQTTVSLPSPVEPKQIPVKELEKATSLKEVLDISIDNPLTRSVLVATASRFPNLGDLNAATPFEYIAQLIRVRELKLGYTDEALRTEVNKVIKDLEPIFHVDFKQFSEIASFYFPESFIAIVPKQVALQLLVSLPYLKHPIELGDEPLWTTLCLCLLEPSLDSQKKKELYKVMDPLLQDRFQKEFPVAFIKYIHPDLPIPLMVAGNPPDEVATAIKTLISIPLKLNVANQLELYELLRKYFPHAQLPLHFFLYTRTLTDDDFKIEDLDRAILGKFIETAKPEGIRQIITAIHDEEGFISHWPIFFLNHPVLAKTFLNTVMGPTKIDFYFRGGSYHNYAQVHRFITGNKAASPVSDLLGNQVKEGVATIALNSVPLNLEIFNDSSQVTLYGRTVVTQCAPLIRCYKFQRKDESSKEFRAESVVLNVMRSSGSFQSKFQEPRGIHLAENHPQWLIDAKIGWLDPVLRQEVFIYDADPGYFVYLHDGKLLQKEWNFARSAWLHDFAVMAKHGFYLVVAPLFHNGNAGRQFLPITDVYFEGKKHTWGTGGAGRLETPFDQTEYPNVGATAVRDVGDYIRYEDAIANPHTFSKDILGTLGGAVRNFIGANALARALLVDALLLVKRYRNQNRLDWRNQELINEAGNTLSEGALRLVAGFTGRDPEECRQLIEKGTIDWQLAAKQLLFWSQNNSEGYLPFVKQETFPSNLYSETTTISVRNNAENFHEAQGYNTQGKQDLGPYNGPLGLDELEKSWYLITGFALALNRLLEAQSRRFRGE